MITQTHKALVIGIVVGMIAMWVWQRRSAGGSSEGA